MILTGTILELVGLSLPHSRAHRHTRVPAHTRFVLAFVVHC